jgi:hypothetical protein
MKFLMRLGRILIKFILFNDFLCAVGKLDHFDYLAFRDQICVDRSIY